MLKDLIFKSKRLLNKEEDKLPLFMRGELEVIVRDEHDRVVDYQKGDNVVTDFMKHEIIHLLAGDLFSMEEQKEYSVTDPTTGTTKTSTIYTKLQENSENHGVETNKDGMLYTNRQFFYTADDLSYKFVSPLPNVNETGVTENYISPRYPVKMLFGTGYEYGVNGFSSLVAEYGHADAVSALLGYDATNFEENINNETNYYSNSFNGNEIERTRTVQSKNTETKSTPILTANDIYGISGAIKNCLIEKKEDVADKYTSGTETVSPLYRGVGRPSFIYASRTLTSVIEESLDEKKGFVKIGKSMPTLGFENKLIFSVVMPRTTTFYPYNGWILKEAGLFSDSLFKIGGAAQDVTSKMPCGTILAKRYISPVLKTSDNSIEFIWSIYISPN